MIGGLMWTIFCGSAGASSAGAAAASGGAAGASAAAGAGAGVAGGGVDAACRTGACGEIRSTTAGGGAFSTTAGSGATGFGGAGGGVGATMREMGGRNDFVVRASPSARFGRGFFSSISETVSTCGFGGGGGGLAAAAAAAACAAARERAAGVVAVGVGGKLLPVFFTALLAGAGASAEAADLTAGFRAAGADLRAAVFVDVVRVGIFGKIFHGSQAAN